jgi:hypothetical protein
VEVARSKMGLADFKSVTASNHENGTLFNVL